ncbi:MAG TPA: CapA family protein [Candidatus Limnocylindrales bacterium]
MKARPPIGASRSRIAGLAVLVTLAVAAGGFLTASGFLAARPTPEGRASSGGGVAPAVTTTPSGSAGSAAAIEGSPTPHPTRGPSVALVPIVGFWSSQRATTSAALADAISGRDPAVLSVVVEAGELAPLAARLQVTPAPHVATGTAAEVRAAVRGHPGVLGILRAEDVTPDVRALSVDGTSLFGVGRARDIAAWPLLVEGATGAPAAFDPARTWTLVAGGDVMLDREVYRQAVTLGKGADWPWDGGTARVVGHVCCDDFGGLLPVAERTGNAGALRALFEDADLAMVNLEGPAPDTFAYHPSGYVFTMDPALLAGLAHAGIDAVSLANNHIAKAGAAGVAQTIGHLDALGIRHAGAGSDVAAARAPAWLTAGGRRIAVLAYDATGLGVTATASRAGSAALVASQAVADIAAARQAGADLVAVWVHWGIEYTAAVTAQQRSLARALAGAGADLVLGGHGHWSGPLETIGSSLVLYDLGDLVFDLVHTVQTEEALVAELTFEGTRLVQIDLRPTLSLDRSQPNLLDPAGDGAAVLGQVRRASQGMLGW